MTESVTHLSEKAVAQLQQQLAGPLWRRDDEGYAQAVLGYNTAAKFRPEIVVHPENEDDVVVAIKWAREHGLKVNVQGSGHGAHYPIVDGLLIDVRRLKGMTIDTENRTWTMGSGMLWRDVLPELHAAGLGAVTGSAGTVNATGLILGGGIGPLGRTFGLAANWARSFRVVDGRGNVVVASADSHPDMFWALRGGKVSLGVVTETTVEALPMPYFYAGCIFYAEEEIGRLFPFWLDWVKDLPNSVTTSVSILRLPPEMGAPLGGKTWFQFKYAYANPGDSNEVLQRDAEDILASWRSFAGTNYAEDGIRIQRSDEVANIHRDPVDAGPLYTYADFLKPVDEDFLSELLDRVGAGKDVPFSNVELRLFGGAYCDEAASPDACAGRNEAFSFIAVGHPDETEVTTAELLAASDDLEPVIAPHRGDEVSLNWVAPLDERTFKNRVWSPEVSARREEVRRTYDPDGTFNPVFW